MRRSEVHDQRRAARAVAATTMRQVGRPAALWGLVFGAMIAATASAYSSSFPTAESRANLAATTEGNVAFTALFGPIHHIDTVAGYTAYKVGMTLMVIAAIWGLFIATRVLRGQEDSGVWELLLSGQTTRGGAAVQAASGLGAGVVALWIPTALITALGGTKSGVDIHVTAALFMASAIVAPAAMFMAVGMLVGQLTASRHDANVIGAGVVAASYLIRMISDSDPALAWLRWASPFGWVEQLRPLTGSHWIAFVPIVAFIAVLVTLAVRIAARRDLGASAIALREATAPRTLLLGGQAGLTLRLTRSAIVGWLLALTASGLAFGLVTQAAGAAFKGSPTLERVIGRLGAQRAGAVLYLGYVFVIAAALISIAVAGQVSAIRNEEASGHLDNLLVRPVARWRWLGVRLAVGAASVILASVLAGVAAWLGAVSQHSHVGFGDLLQAGLNVASPGLFVLGAGTLVYGVLPRLAVGVTYGLVIWSAVVEIVSAIVDSNHWLRDTSPLLHITPAPAAAPNWTSAGWLVGLGLLACIAGLVAFNRRDLQGA